MSNLPKKCLMDTNVPKTANLAVDVENIPSELIDCVLACIEAVEHVIHRKGRLVIDAGDEIFTEYRGQLSLSGRNGIGDAFMKWVHDHRWSFPEQDRVKISKSGDSYHEFPDHDGLKDFDPSDRKFIAVSNAHPEKPAILEATDSKWWGWKEALREVGIQVRFLCPEYAEKKYLEKMSE